jgi:hypothetical protein
MNDQQLHAHCTEWASWCYTRRFYLRPGAQNILARMQPSRTGVEPNARNNPDMQFFNMAVHTLADMAENAAARECFTLMYVEQVDHVKRQAENLGISRPTYYNRSRAFARKALSLAQSLKRVHLEQAPHQQDEPLISED